MLFRCVAYLKIEIFAIARGVLGRSGTAHPGVIRSLTG